MIAGRKIMWTQLEVNPDIWIDPRGQKWIRIAGKYSWSEAKKRIEKETEMGLKWKLPTKKDFLQAELDDIRDHVTDVYHTFWSETPSDETGPRQFSGAGAYWIFFGGEGGFLPCVRGSKLEILGIERKITKD